MARNWNLMNSFGLKIKLRLRYICTSPVNFSCKYRFLSGGVCVALKTKHRCYRGRDGETAAVKTHVVNVANPKSHITEEKQATWSPLCPHVRRPASKRLPHGPDRLSSEFPISMPRVHDTGRRNGRNVDNLSKNKPRLPGSESNCSVVECDRYRNFVYKRVSSVWN